MPLHEVLKKIAAELGEQSLTENNIVNVISDYDSSAFQPDSLKTILKVMVSENYLKRILVLNGLNEIKKNQIKKEFVVKNGFQADQVDYIIESFEYGLGYIKNVKSFSIISEENESNHPLQQVMAENAFEKDKKISTLPNNTNTKNVISGETKAKKYSPPKTPLKTKHKPKRGEKDYKGCGCLIIGFIIMGIIGSLFNDSESKNSQETEKSSEIIFLARKEMDTLKWDDGTPKEMKSIEKRDVQLILGKDTLYIITPYKSVPKLNILFRDKIYNREAKEMQEEHNYSFALIRENGTQYVYGKPKKYLPVVEQNQINNRIDHIKFEYPPENSKNYQPGFEYEYGIYIFTSEIEEKICNYFSIYK